MSKIRDIYNLLRSKESPPSAGELGATGTMIFSGILTETEYNADLKGDKAFKVYERMRKSDGQVKAGLLACKLPLVVAHWDIKPGGNTAQDKKIADEVGSNLFDEMTITWDDFLRHALIMFDFGFMPFEKIWELRGGLYKWRKLAPRMPETVSKWYVDDEGGLAGIQQRAWKAKKYQYVDIPVEKLLVFTHEREGSNFQGVSLLRAAYKHWYYKNNLYAIDGIAAERHGVGVADFSYPTNATDAQKEAIERMGERLHAHERAYVAHPEDIKFDLKGVAGQLHNILGSIEHHDLQIVRSILAQFINLGSKEVGSYALSSDQQGFFLMALKAAGNYVTETINRHAIKQMVDYNWEVGGKYPKLIVSGLEHFDITAYSTAINQLATAGALVPDDAMEDELRRIIKMPVRKAAPKRPTPTEETLKASEWVPRRRLRGPEQHVAFADIKGKLDDVEQRFVDAVAPIQKRQIRNIVNVMSDYLDDGEYDRITEIDVPYRDKVAGAIDSLLVELMEYGEEQVKEEIQKQQKSLKAADLPNPPGHKAFLRVRALAIANILANKMRAAMAWEALHQIKEGVLDKAGLTASLTELSDRELRSTAKFSASEAFNMGRGEQAKELKDVIDRVISSAILDENTCGYCNDLDGQEWKYGEAPDEPPYKLCEGEDRCRCVHIYVYKEEIS